MQGNRVVVCSLGMVTPLGWDVDETWKNIINGKSGISKIKLFDPDEFGIKSKVAGEIKNWDSSESPKNNISKKRIKKLDRYAQFGYVSALEAIKKSGLDIEKLSFEVKIKAGVIVGTGGAGLYLREKALSSYYLSIKDQKIKNNMSVFQVILDMINSLSSQISMDLGFCGVSFSLGTACSSGADAIGISYNYIQSGLADIIIAIGAEACETPYNVKGFDLMKALTTRNCKPEEASCPFSINRDGFIFAEGAGALLLASYEFAKIHDLPILAEIVGYSNTNDAFHEAKPGEMQNVCMKLALIRAGIEKVDYINAHGTSTPKNDAHETSEIKKVFGADAYKIPVSSTKSMTGHGIGATGAWEAIFSILAINNGIISPTINLYEPDPECDLDYVPNTAREANIKYVMSNSFGFGGQNAVLVFKKFE